MAIHDLFMIECEKLVISLIYNYVSFIFYYLKCDRYDTMKTTELKIFSKKTNKIGDKMIRFNVKPLVELKLLNSLIR